MGDIIALTTKASTASDAVDDAYLLFLTEEGLDLLALYREIPDASVRMAVLRMVKALASSTAANAIAGNRG